MIHTRRITLAAICTLAVWLMPVVSAMAQIPSNPGQPAQPSSSVIYGAYIAAFVLVIAVGYASFKNSKRTHQD